MKQRAVYVLVDGKGNLIKAGDRSQIEKAAVARASKSHGMAFVEEDAPEQPKTDLQSNPPSPELALKAYQATGLDRVCLALYGQSSLTLNLVESISLSDALRRLRPYLPDSSKYESLSAGMLGGGAIDLSSSAADEMAERYEDYEQDDDGRYIEYRLSQGSSAEYESFASEDEAAEAAAARGGAGWKIRRMKVPMPRDPIPNAYGMLARNAKLAKGKSPDGRLSLAFGLSLAPHQIGLRGFGNVGTSPKQGFHLLESDLLMKKIRPVVEGVVRDNAAIVARYPVGSRAQEQEAVSLFTSGRDKSITTCPGANAACRSSCLVHSGQNAASVEALTSKLALTRALYADPAAFCRLLLENLRRYFTEAAGCKPADLFVRLNVFSDIPWEQLFPDLLDPVKRIALREPDGSAPSKYQPGDWESRPLTGAGSFYDYTKVPLRLEWYARHIAAEHNLDEATALSRCKGYYHLTFSYSGTNMGLAQDWLERGGKVAVVFVLERTERDWLDREVSAGPPAPVISGDLVGVRFPWVPAAEVNVFKGLWQWASTGEEPSAQSVVGKLFKGQVFPPPIRNPRRNPLPPGLLQQERLGFVAKYLTERLRPYFPADRDAIDVSELWLPVTPSGSAHLRGRIKSEFYGDVVKFPAGHPFHGYKIINADKNDLRAKDALLVPGAALVGLDYKVAKVRVAVDKWIAFEGKTKGDQKGIEFLNEDDVKAYIAAHPGWNYRRKGELFYERLDLSKNSLAVPVRATSGADGREIFTAPQIPRQTMKGSQEHG